MDIPAAIKSKMELRAVLYFKPLYSQIAAHEEPDGLLQQNKIKDESEKCGS